MAESQLPRLEELNEKLSKQLVIDFEMFQRTVDALPDGMLLVNEDGIIEFVNQQIELLFGYSRSTLLGEPVHILLAPELAEIHRAHIAKFFIQPVARPMNFAKALPGRHRSGRTVMVQISLGYTFSPKGVLAIALVRRVVDGQ